MQHLCCPPSDPMPPDIMNATVAFLGSALGALALLPALSSTSSEPHSLDLLQGSHASVSSSAGNIGAIAWGEANGDGHRDAVVLGADGALTVWIHRGAEGLVSEPMLLPFAEQERFLQASWSDTERNGVDDLLLVRADGGLVFLRNRGESFEDATAEVGLEQSGVRFVRWLDVDGDGALDLVTHAVDGIRLHANEAGHFEEQRLTTAFPATASGIGPKVLADPATDERPNPTETDSANGPRRGFGPGERLEPDPLDAVVQPTFGGTPFEEAGQAVSCAQTLRDMGTGACLAANSIATIGSLYPLSTTFNIEDSTQRVAIGTDDPTAKLMVNGGFGSDAGHFVGSLKMGALAGKAFLERVALTRSSAGAGTLELFADSGALQLFATASQSASDGAILRLYNTLGTLTTELDGDTSTGGGLLSLATSTGSETIELLAQETGGTGARVSLSRGDGAQTVRIDAQTTHAAELSLYTKTGVETFEVLSEETDGTGSQIVMRSGTGAAAFVMDAEGTNAADFGMFDSGGTETIELLAEETSGTGSQIILRRASGGASFLLDSEGPLAAEFGMFDSSGNETVEILAEEVAGDGAQIVLRKGDGTASIVLDAEAGTSGRITTEVLEITGGADLVESFDTGASICTPGSVVVIDPERPGELTLSTRAYDSRVAGIVSGAGDVRPGLHMGQTGVASGDTPVALTGRVYVKACAENGPIRPGDLLTTSSRAGHAMRATDATASFGAILGKAMGALEGESGLVLVLVSLQ